MVTDYFLINLKQLMDNSQIDQSELARILGIHQSTVNNWWRKKSIPRDDTLEAIASYFNIEPFYFFMKPGSQGEVKPTERHDEFKAFLDKLAVDHLSKIDLEAYHAQGGANQFVKQMRDNLETSFLGFQDWYQILAKEVTRYAGLDLVEKVKRDLQKNKTEAKKNETA